MTTERDRIIARALGERRIPADRADYYRGLYDADPVMARRLLTASVSQGGLAPQSVTAEDAAQLSEADAYPAHWLGSREPVPPIASDDGRMAVPASPAPADLPRGLPRITVEP